MIRNYEIAINMKEHLKEFYQYIESNQMKKGVKFN